MLIFVCGTRYMGKCDVVARLFFVKTRFFHFYYLPLVPLNSAVCISECEGSIRGASIPLSFKSVLLAWGRGALVFLSSVFTVFAFIAFVAPGITLGKSLPEMVVTAAAGWGLVALTWSKWVCRASFRRACQLAVKLKYDEQGLAALEQIYGRTVPRGFDVKAFMPLIGTEPPPRPTAVARPPAVGDGRVYHGP